VKRRWGGALTHPTHLHPEVAGSKYLQNIDNTVRIHTVQTLNSRINNNNNNNDREPEVSKTTIVRF
jgi:hypothetical protein